LRRDFVYQERTELSFGFGHGANALGAQHLLDLAIALVNRHLLQVRFELTIGGTHGERPVMSKSCRLSAMGALSHLTNFLSCYNSGVLACSRKHSILPHIVSFNKKGVILNVYEKACYKVIRKWRTLPVYPIFGNPAKENWHAHRYNN
jgi:hypothetical protein